MAKSTIIAGFSSSASVEGVGQNEPSLCVGVADFDRNAFARAVNVARTETGAGNRVFHGRDDDAKPDLQTPTDDHVSERERRCRAGHILFHVEHAAIGLDIEPAGVEANTFADQCDLRVAGLAPGDVDQSWLSCRTGSDRVHERKVFRERIAAGDPYLGAVPPGEGATGRFQFGRAHVVGRRVGQVAAQRDALNDAAEIVAIDAVGDDKVDFAGVGLAVARELVGAERERERSQPRIVRCVGEAISAGRQLAGQLSGPEAVYVAFAGFFDPEQHAGELSVRSRQQQQPARFGLETAGRDKGASALADFLLD